MQSSKGNPMILRCKTFDIGAHQQDMENTVNDWFDGLREKNIEVAVYQPLIRDNTLILIHHVEVIPNQVQG